LSRVTSVPSTSETTSRMSRPAFWFNQLALQIRWAFTSSIIHRPCFYFVLRTSYFILCFLLLFVIPQQPAVHDERRPGNIVRV
jgi:hypothetical protein